LPPYVAVVMRPPIISGSVISPSILRLTGSIATITDGGTSEPPP